MTTNQDNAAQAIPKLIVPCVHMNGTGRDDLLEQLEAAYMAIGDAMDALSKASPNARDYYVYDSDAYSEARDQHYARARKLQSVRDELEVITNAIFDQTFNGRVEKYAELRVD